MPMLRAFRNGQRFSRIALAVMTCWVAVCLTLSGCSGCRRDPATDEKDEKPKKKPKPDYEIGRLEVMPSDDALMRNFVKPGHVATASFRAIANNFDLRAELKTEVTALDQTVIPVGDTRFHMLASRTALLPKGQPKVFESTYFIPNDVGKENSTLFLHHMLNSARGGSLVYENAEPTRQMPPHQYLFVVLAANPNAYGYVKTMHSMVPSVDDILDETGEVVYYRVVLPKIDDRAPLPSSLNAWTAIAYVLWDGMPVDRLTADQQRAMIDWLHWGGQLIVSGPDTLEQLAGSFLAPYLPATSGGTEELKSSQFEPLNAAWTLARKKSGERLALKVLDTSPLVGVRLRLGDQSRWLDGTGELVAERRVGRGRTVVTSFALRNTDIVNWGSFDSFMNGGLLRRPPRVFSVTADLGAPRMEWAGLPSGRRDDPRLISATRFFARDVAPGGESTELTNASSYAPWVDEGCEPHATGGVASWNDRSGASLLAHASLRRAAGISIPKARFVLSVLAVYLLVLVPVNWTVFRLMGRVEWAWVAAPVIALIGAVAVIRLAQLDIGFVRSRTEIGVMEVQGERPQAHLTRYTALYSSLSTAYEFQFDDVAAVARPFVPTPSPDTLWPIESTRDDGTRVTGFQVDSSTTGFIHSEQMCELEGAVRLKDATAGEWQIENGSGLNLRQVQVLARDDEGRLTEGKLAELAAGESGRVPRTPFSSVAQGAKAGDSAGEIDVQDLANQALRRMVLRPGDVRLVAWTDDPLPGLEITPAASQVVARTVVLVHLRYGALPPPGPDANLLSDVFDPATAGPRPTENFDVEDFGNQEKMTPQ